MGYPGRSALLLAMLVAFLATGQSSAAATPWQLHDLPGEGRNTKLLGISCPSVRLCVAVGEGSVVASSSAPTTGPWKTVQVGQGLIERERPPPPPGFPPPPDPSLYRDLHGISCPSENLCVAVSFDGYAFWSTDPTGRLPPGGPSISTGRSDIVI